MIVSSIVAVALNGVIGRNGTLPWHLADDMSRFRKITMGHSVIMGRRNFDDIGFPLHGRTNYVVTHDRNYLATGCTVVGGVDEAIRMAEAAGDTECFIIGGASIYLASESLVSRLYITRVMSVVEGDTRFTMPLGEWTRVGDGGHPAGPGNDYAVEYEIWSRKA